MEIEGELWLIVWEVRNTPNCDIGGSDLFVKTIFDLNEENYTTDTHFNAQSGKGNFNWRKIIPFKIDSQSDLSKCQLFFQVFDKDLFSSNEFIL